MKKFVEICEHDTRKLAEAMSTGEVGTGILGGSLQEYDLSEADMHQLAKSAVQFLMEQESMSYMARAVSSKRWLNTEEAMFHSGRSRNWLKALYLAGEIDAFKDPDKGPTSGLLFDRHSIDAYYERTIKSARLKAKELATRARTNLRQINGGGG